MADAKQAAPGRIRRVRVRMLSATAFHAIIVASLALGPGMMVAFGVSVVWRSRHVVERATAEVTNVAIVQSANSTHYCPTFRWHHGGAAHEHRSRYCGDHGDFERGQQVAIRFAASDPASVVPDSVLALYGDALIGIPASLLPTAILFVAIQGLRRRRRLERDGRRNEDGTFSVEMRL